MQRREFPKLLKRLQITRIEELGNNSSDGTRPMGPDRVNKVAQMHDRWIQTTIMKIYTTQATKYWLRKTYARARTHGTPCWIS
jgi:hypothetical protein